MAYIGRPNKIILADSHIFHGRNIAKELAIAEDMRIVAHCADLDQMYSAIATFPDSIVLFATSLQPDFTRLQILLDTTGSRGIVIAENNDTADKYLQMGIRGVIFRSDNGPTLVECVHRVAAGDFWLAAQLMQPDLSDEEIVGSCRNDRLTQSKLRLLSKLAFGLCTRLRVGVGETMRPFGST
jgi:DNA-binding NarL/FixJ family response regulator